MYKVSSCGTIYSNYIRRDLRPYVGKRGYKMMHVKMPDGTYKHRYIHQMVAETFLDNPDNKPHINHKDSNKLNNHADNLEWCTNSENRKHSVVKGRHPRGNTHGNSKLTEDIVRRICSMFQAGHTIGMVADYLCDWNPVSRGSLLNIRARRTWTHISKDYHWDKKNTANSLSKGATTIQ